MKSRWQLIGLIVLCQAVGLLGARFTLSSIDSWYAGLVKPWFNPPNWVFGPVWTILYLMMAIACWLILKHQSDVQLKRRALLLFGVQLVLNGIWTPLFFGLRNPGLAFFDIVILWLLIGMTVLTFKKISKPAAFLLLPYWLWVTYASLLNAALWHLN